VNVREEWSFVLCRAYTIKCGNLVLETDGVDRYSVREGSQIDGDSNASSNAHSGPGLQVAAEGSVMR
jgi:hypothetical protein